MHKSSHTVPDNVQLLRKDGYVILEHIFSKSLIEKLYQYFTLHYATHYHGKLRKNRLTINDGRFMIPISLSGEINNPQIYANDNAFDILKNVLESNFIINSFTCVVSLPQADQCPLHQDGTIHHNNPLSPMLPPHGINLFIPLAPINKLNGPTGVIPGSHLSSTISKQDQPVTDIIIDTGSAFLMDYRLFHRGGPNLSDNIRPVLIISYCNTWYIDHHNFQKTVNFKLDDEELLKIPEKHRYLFIRRNIDFSKTIQFSNVTQP